MALRLQSPGEIDRMALAGAAARRVLERSLTACTPGATTGEVALVARREILAAGAEILFEGYAPPGRTPFPAAACVCVNEEVVHGVPGPRVLEAGDLVSVDVGLRLEGWCADVADSAVVGRWTAGRAADLAEAARGVVRAVTGAMGPGVSWASAAEAGRRAAERAGLALVPGFVGHGIGRSLHEPLWAPLVDAEGGAIAMGGREDFVLWPGMCLTVEPIVAEARPGGLRTEVGPDGWTVRLVGGGRAAQAEETVAVTEDGVRVLTGRRDVREALRG